MRERLLALQVRDGAAGRRCVAAANDVLHKKKGIRMDSLFAIKLKYPV